MRHLVTHLTPGASACQVESANAFLERNVRAGGRGDAADGVRAGQSPRPLRVTSAWGAGAEIPRGARDRCRCSLPSVVR